MSMWTPIVSGRRASAALRGVTRRWCVAVEWKSRHREQLRPRGAPGTRETRLDGDRGPFGVPENCELKIPLLIPCRVSFLPVSGAQKFPARQTTNGAGLIRTSLIRRNLSAIGATKSRTPLQHLGNFSLLSGRSRDRGFRPHTEKYFAWGWWTTIAEVDCSGSSWSSSERVMPISSALSNARSCFWSARFGQAG